MELKPGEYVGQDGATYSVTHIYAKWRDGDGYHGTQAVRPTDPDFPAALAALQALYDESQKAPWVRIDIEDGYERRIRDDGTDPQWRICGDSAWYRQDINADWVVIARAMVKALAVKR